MTETAQQPQQENLVDVTEAAASKLKEALKDKPGWGIRLGVAGGGCAGLQYEVVPAEAPDEGDFVQEFYDVRFFIHPMVLPYLKGTRLDYSDALMEGGFKFQNPNASSSCGCGTSFGM